MNYRYKFWQQNKSFLIILVVVASYYLKQYFSFRLGLHFEEGRDANAYLLAIQGNLAYRDFQWVYGPFAFFVYPVLMKIFGFNLIVLRVSYIVFTSLIIPLAYFLARRIMPPLWAGIAAFLSIVFFDVPYYTYNHIFLTLGAMICLLMICLYMETNRKILYLILAGISCSICLLTKPLVSGITIFAAISLFILLYKDLGSLGKRFKDILMFSIAAVFLPLIYSLYFYFQTRLKGIAVAHPYFAKDSSLFADQAPRIMSIIPRLIERITTLLPIKTIINLTSFTELKKVLIASFDNFIVILPFLTCALLLLVYNRSKFSNQRTEIREEIKKNKRFFLLFGLFSIFISLESLVMSHIYNRSFTIQTPFIVTVYLLYLFKRIHQRKRLFAAILIVLFSLSFVSFFRYPYSRLKKNTKILNLERSRGILVTPQEKRMYESLSLYLSDNLKAKDKIAVIGYYPQLSFLTEQENIFAKDDYIFPNLEVLFWRARKTGRAILSGNLLENKIMSMMRTQKPKIVLTINADYLPNFRMISPKIKDYLAENYLLERKFEPAQILGNENEKARVYAYKLN
ncbi:MAG: glycosyltransferase family 39 protein [Candidatus Omnitrophica bacterium]|nr:glycosyltransferase family 39 protein [Candidatus Omnitrophota bacterium]